MWIRFIFAGFLLELCTVSFCQMQSDPGKHPGSNFPVNRVNTIMASMDYTSNTQWLGNLSDKRQPGFAPSLSFLSRWGVDLDLLGYAMENSDDSLKKTTYELDLIGGYSFEPIRDLLIYPSYCHFLYSRNSNAVKSIFANDFRLDVDYTYSYIDMGITGGYLTGKQSTWYGEVRTGYTLTFDHFLSSRVSLSIQPNILANFGNYEYLNLYYIDQLTQNPLFYDYLLLSKVIRRYVMAEKLRYPYLTRQQIIQNYLFEKAKDSFRLTSMGFILPVNFLIGNLGINAGFFVMVPVNQPDYMNGDVQFFYNVGLSYTFTTR